jgi:hypothetical protein
VFEFGGFVVSTGGGAPLTDTLMNSLTDHLRTRQGSMSMDDAEVIGFYRLTMSLGLVASHKNILDGSTPL